jgi:hypothetical protein
VGSSQNGSVVSATLAASELTAGRRGFERADGRCSREDGMMTIRLLCTALLAGLVAACATSLPKTSFAEPATVKQAMQGYYEGHATEEYGYCSTPYIDGLTQVKVVTDQPDRLVLDVRYLYRDRFKQDRGDNRGHECTNYGGRRFTFGKSPAGNVEVADMTGPRRRARRKVSPNIRRSPHRSTSGAPACIGGPDGSSRVWSAAPGAIAGSDRQQQPGGVRDSYFHRREWARALAKRGWLG